MSGFQMFPALLAVASLVIPICDDLILAPAGAN